MLAINHRFTKNSTFRHYTTIKWYNGNVNDDVSVYIESLPPGSFFPKIYNPTVPHPHINRFPIDLQISPSQVSFYSHQHSTAMRGKARVGFVCVVHASIAPQAFRHSTCSWPGQAVDAVQDTHQHFTLMMITFSTFACYIAFFPQPYLALDLFVTPLSLPNPTKSLSVSVCLILSLSQ